MLNKYQYDAYLRAIALRIKDIQYMNSILREQGTPYVVHAHLYNDLQGSSPQQIKLTTERGKLELPTDATERVSIVGCDRYGQTITEAVESLVDVVAGIEIVTLHEHRHRAMTEKEIEKRCAKRSR